MNLFLEFLRCILCCHEERDDDNDDLASCTKPFLESFSAKVRNRNPAYEYLPVNTTPSNSPRSRVTLSAPLYQPNVGNSPTTKPPYSQKSMERTNDVYQNSTSSSPLPPTFPYSSKLLQYTSSPFPSSSKSATSSSKPSASFPNALLSSSKPPQSVSKLSPPSSSLKDPTYSSKSSASSSNLPSYSFSPSSKSSVSSPNDPKPPPESSPTYSKPPQSLPSLTPSSSKPLPSSPKPASSHKPSLSSPKGLPSSSGPPPSSPSQTPAFKPILYLAPSNVINEEMKMSYVLGKGTSRIYAIPEDIKGLIKKDILPEVLKQPLSPSTYKHYFTALLYAEDFHLEKWSNFQLKNVILKLHEAEIYNRPNKNKHYNRQGRSQKFLWVEANGRKKNLGNLGGGHGPCQPPLPSIPDNRSVEKDDKIFVVFEIDSIPEKRPFLLSRDLVYARPSGKNVEPFRGFIYRVVKSTRVLVEFGDNFHSQHCSTRKYDISFSFNRVCLKRAHQAIEAASNPLFQNFVFPECTSRKNILNPPAQLSAYRELGIDEFAAVHHILSFRGSPPYLLGGSLSVTRAGKSVTEETRSVSRTGVVVREAVFEAYKTSPNNRILVCAPINSTCDVLNRSLKKKIPESDMFRANAAFREIDEVPTDILSSCPIEGECFACPSLQQLLRFRIILSTFMSSFRLHNEGIAAGHFSHIFLVDASSATEPEAMVALANFADDNTAVIVTGAPRNHPGWVRSDIARKYGLSKSYFERLHELRPYSSTNPKFVTELDDFKR